MKKELDLVEEFHNKFTVLVSKQPSLISNDKSSNRHWLMKDEVDEYLEGAQKGDLENVAKELADILYAVYGTVLEHGLQDKMEDIFEEVHRSHMTKEKRPYKMKKGVDFVEADIHQFFIKE